MGGQTISPQSIHTKKVVLDFLYKQLYFFEFNIVRHQNVRSFEDKLEHFFNILTSQNKYTSDIDNSDFILLLQRYIHLTVFIRNKHHGKGQKLQFYAMIFHLYEYNSSFAVQLIESIWKNGLQTIHIGSFCDFKYLCQYIYERTNNRRHPFIEKCCRVFISLLCNSNNYFMAKWTPREHSSFQWLYNKLVYYYAKQTTKNITSYKRKQNKFKNIFRRFVSSLCTYKTESILALNALQDKSCFLFSPLSNILKYKHRIIQSPNWGIQRLVPPHQLVSASFEPGKIFKHMYKLLDTNKHLNYDSLHGGNYKSVIDFLNSVWAHYIHKCSTFMGEKDFILLVDVSIINFDGSDNTFYDMVGMALFTMHFSKAKKRILFASNTPCWMNFSHCETLYECVVYLKQQIVSMCCHTSCEMISSISTLLRAFQDTPQSPFSIYTFDLIFLHGNRNAFSKPCIECVKHYKSFFNKFIFWNFCNSHTIQDIEDIQNFEKKCLFISGNNTNSLLDICNTTTVLHHFLHKIRQRHYLILD